MHERPTTTPNSEETGDQTGQPDRAPERRPEDRPQIYVADLAAYNDGRLHGRWLDADQTPDQLSDEIAAMLASSPVPGAEEWAIHDYEGFAGIRLGVYEPVETISRLAQGIVAHGRAFAALAEWLGTADATEDAFDEHYRGSWPTVEDYADEQLRDLGIHDCVEQLSGWAVAYIRVDTDAYARDLQLGGDIHTATDGDRVHIFDTHP